MPGNKVKNWSKYHKLRRKGFSKSSAARITNSKPGKRRKSKSKKRRK